MPSLSLKAFFLLVLAVPGLAAPLDGTRKVVKRCRAHSSSASGNSFFGQSKDHTTSVTTSSAPAPTTSTSSEAAVQSEAAPTSSEAPPASSAAAQPSASAAADSGSGTTGNADADLFVKLHTDFRAQYGAGAVTWNTTMADYAANAANSCNYGHTGGPYGENIAAGVGGGYNITSAFDSWAGEAAKYDWNNPGYSEGTGHFTQIVWKGTSEIGCAAAKCADNTIFKNYKQDSLYVVCEYLAAGNVVGDNNQYFKDNVGIKISINL